MKVHLLSAIFFSLIASECSSQVHEGELSNADSSNCETIRQAIQYLKNKQSISLTVFNPESVTTIHAFYKEFFEKYFDRGFLADTAGKHALMTATGQALILYNIDNYLDILPIDSIYISPLKLLNAKEAEQDRHNTLITYYRLDGRIFNVNSILFNDKGKLLGIAPYIDFNHNNEGIEVERFYFRHGLNRIKDKLYKF